MYEVMAIIKGSIDNKPELVYEMQTCITSLPEPVMT